MRTDYVDLYQCHRYDHDTPLEETMDAMSEVVRAGKARYISFSEWSRRRIEAANMLNGVTRFVPASRNTRCCIAAEPEIFPLCKEFGIGQIFWSPLAHGALTGKYVPGQPLPRDSRGARRGIRRYTEENVLAAVQNLRPIAERLSLSMSQLALAWVLKHDTVSSAIIGATPPEQIEENVVAVGVLLDAATLQEIDVVLDGVLRN